MTTCLLLVVDYDFRSFREWYSDHANAGMIVLHVVGVKAESHFSHMRTVLLAVPYLVTGPAYR